VVSVDIETFAHATEDPEKVLKSLKFILPEEILDEVKIKREELKGHYKNPIIIFRTAIRRKRLVKKVISHIAKILSEKDKKRIKSSFNRRLDPSGNLYLRFDKQEAYLGKAVLTESGDSIRVKIAFTSHPLELNKILGFCKEIGLVT